MNTNRKSLRAAAFACVLALLVVINAWAAKPLKEVGHARLSAVLACLLVNPAAALVAGWAAGRRRRLSCTWALLVALLVAFCGRLAWRVAYNGIGVLPGAVAGVRWWMWFGYLAFVSLVYAVSFIIWRRGVTHIPTKHAEQ